MFIVLLTSLANVSSHAKYIFLNTQKCEIQPALINCMFLSCHVRVSE